MRSIDEKRLLYFHETVAAGTMRAASDKLGLAPSSVSRQIALLEQAVGLPLIERGRRRIRLTEAGQLVLDYFRERRAHDEVFHSRLEDLHGLKKGIITIAMGEGFISHRMSTVLSRFSRDFPGIQVTASIAHSNEIVRQVIEDEAHFGMVIQAPHEPKLTVRWSSALELKAIIPAGHDLAKRASVRLAELTAFPLGLVDTGFRIRQAIEEAEARENVFLSPVLSTNSLFLLRRFVASGGGITIMPETVFRREVEEGTVDTIAIENDALVRPMAHIITRAGRQLPTAALKLLGRLQKAELL